MSNSRTILPSPLYTAEQTRLLDRTAIDRFGISGFRLMKRAGHAAFAVLQEYFPQVRRLSILAGCGNNGGDGFVVAALARQNGFDVQLVCVGDENFAQRLRNEALQAWQMLQELGVGYTLYHPGMELTGELLVDAMLGTGLTGEVRGAYAEAIGQLNRSPKPVLAVDVPSGLCADTGRVLGCAVRADLTLSFIGLNRGLLTGDGADHAGRLLFDNLHLPDDVFDEVPVQVFRTTAEDLAEILPPRKRNAHKGLFGHLLVVGGDQGMGGAALLAAEAALRSGTGLVSLATRTEHIAAALSRCPEVMCRGVEAAALLQPMLVAADVIVIGPGLGRSAWSEQMLMAVLNSGKPLVVDADALNLMVLKGLFEQGPREHCIFTPHPGEASKILQLPVSQLQQDRFQSVVKLQRHCGGAVVLKGAGSLSCAGEVIHLCDAGNPGMSVGGMGDVLAGICGAMLAQRLSVEDAARLAVYIHAAAADQVAIKQGERGMLASDLFGTISRVINGLYDGE